MITVYIPNHFIPERTYIVSTLLTHYLGAEIEILPRAGQLHYELVWNEKKIIIRDQFFGHTVVGQTYIDARRIPAKINEASATELDKILVLFGDDHVEIRSDGIICDADIFAGAFFMLTRWEEAIGHNEDVHGRFPAADALLVKSGHILRPVVDEYVALLQKWLRQLGYQWNEKVHTLKIVPTVDVDIAWYWLRKPRWKVYAREWMQHKSLSTLIKTRDTIRQVEAGDIRDPFDTYDTLMSQAEKAGHAITFYMIAGGLSKYEGYYSVKDARVKKLMVSFQERGHQIGLHPSYNTFHDPRLIAEEKKTLEAVTGEYVVASRQHYLKFSVPATWRYLYDAGITSDSTMGYAAAPGFRCGTSRPFPVFDIYKQETLPLMEHPLLVMDVSLKMYLKLSAAESLALIRNIYSQVEKHGGEFVFIWHNSNLSKVEEWAAWNQVWEQMVQFPQ